MSAARNRSGGYLVVLLVVIGAAGIATFVLGRSYSALALQKEPFQRLSYVPSFDPIEDVVLGVGSDSGNSGAVKPNPAIRTIEVYPTQTNLVAGGKVTRSINAKAPATLSSLVRLVNNPEWIAQSGQSITMNTAVVLEHGSAMTIAAPTTKQVVMTVRQGVFLAANNSSKLTMAGVYFHASNTATPATFSLPSQENGRPFILAVAHSTMTVTHCTFRYLGRDWNSSYGLSWSKGSTGSVTSSQFEHDFIGVYSNDAHGLSVTHNAFYNNSLYGIDPHSGSSDLDIEYNISNFNGRHGIIFSNHVTDGVVRYNTTKGNGLNGIMMDEASTDNQIDHNTVTDNGSAGIVIASSSNNQISQNTVSHNRVGVTVRGTSSKIQLSGNTVAHNRLAAQGTSLSGNQVYDNGGQWSARRIAVIWLGALALLLALMAVTWLSNRRHTHGRHVRGRRSGEVGTA